MFFPNYFCLNLHFCDLSKNSEMDRLGRWLGKKKPERSSRVTRSTASPSTTRVIYNEEIIPLEVLDASSAKAWHFHAEISWRMPAYRRSSTPCVPKQVEHCL